MAPDSNIQGEIPSLLTIVMPVFNEEKTISETVRSCVDIIGVRFSGYEIIVVDDASSDGTGDALEEMQHTIVGLQVLRNSRNLGHGAALQRGLEAARGDLVFVIDSDYQHEPADFWLLYEVADEDTIVIGCRKERVDGWYRRLASALGNRLVGMVAGGRVRDVNIPFKLFPGPALRNLIVTLPARSLIPSTLLVAGAIQSGIPIRQVPVVQLPRRYGTSTLPGLRFVNFGARAALELLRYRAGFRSRVQASLAAPRSPGR